MCIRDRPQCVGGDLGGQRARCEGLLYEVGYGGAGPGESVEPVLELVVARVGTHLGREDLLPVVRTVGALSVASAQPLIEVVLVVGAGAGDGWASGVRLGVGDGVGGPPYGDVAEQAGVRASG